MLLLPGSCVALRQGTGEIGRVQVLLQWTHQAEALMGSIDDHSLDPVAHLRIHYGDS